MTPKELTDRYIAAKRAWYAEPSSVRLRNAWLAAINEIRDHSISAQFGDPSEAIEWDRELARVK